MKKLLLTLAAIIGLSMAASADEVTFDFSKPDTWGYSAKPNNGADYDSNKPLTVGDVTIACDTKDAATGGGKLRFWFPQNTSTATDFRCSANGGKKNQTLTFTANGGSITKIVFNAAKFALTANVGTLGAYANKQATWEGNATEVVFTTSDACTFNSIVVTYTPSGDDRTSANLKFAESSKVLFVGDTFTNTLTKDTDATVSYSSSDETVATVDAEGKVTALALGTATIKAATDPTDTYFAGSASYTVTVVKKYNSVAEFYTLPKNGKGIVNFDLVVTYVNEWNCYAQTLDGAEATLIYGSNAYKKGDVIPAGWEGQYSPFNALPEIKPVGTLPEAAGTQEVVYPEVTSITLEDANKVVVLKNVEFAEATPAGKTNFTGTIVQVATPAADGDDTATSYTFRNNFTLTSVEAGIYNPTVAVSIYKSDNDTSDAAPILQLYPIEYGEMVTTGIDGVVVDENAPVEYYNLQGVRVDNPEGGLFIRRQGSKVTKVIR